MIWKDFSVVIGFRSYSACNQEFGILAKSLRSNNARLIVSEIGREIGTYCNYHPTQDSERLRCRREK